MEIALTSENRWNVLWSNRSSCQRRRFRWTVCWTLIPETNSRRDEANKRSSTLRRVANTTVLSKHDIWQDLYNQMFIYHKRQSFLFLLHQWIPPHEMSSESFGQDSCAPWSQEEFSSAHYTWPLAPLTWHLLNCQRHWLTANGRNHIVMIVHGDVIVCCICPSTTCVAQTCRDKSSKVIIIFVKPTNKHRFSTNQACLSTWRVVI